MKKPWPTRILKALASIKLAVFIMVGLIILIAAGTIIESRLDAEAAKKMIYDTWWMTGLMALLATSLTAVLIDRWPWKVRHVPFICAHIGILVLMLGAVLTVKFGLDGTITIPIGEDSRYIVLPGQTDILVYASFGGNGMTKLHEEAVDFFRHPPTVENPVRINSDAGTIDLIDYRKYVLPKKQVLVTDEATAGAGVRFQIQNSRVSVVEWLVQRRPEAMATHDFGPAQIHLGVAPTLGRGKNEIWLTAIGDKIHWVVYRKDADEPFAKGVTEEGGKVQTGWMGLELRILRYLPKAREEWDFDEIDHPTPLTTSAVKVRFLGKEHWLLLDDTLRLFTQTTAYMVSYLHRRIDLGFPIALKSFEMVPYEGTSKAKEYRSHVQLPGAPEEVISMNEPAKYQGLTIYQASFQNDESGKPVASVFSVNSDPGRVWKYLGALIISVGIIWLFYSRRRPKAAATTKDV